MYIHSHGMKHHATVQHVRERYNNHREKNPKKLIRIFFTMAVIPLTHVLNRGMMLHMFQDAFRAVANRCRKIPPAPKDLADTNFELIKGAFLNTYISFTYSYFHTYLKVVKYYFNEKEIAKKNLMHMFI